MTEERRAFILAFRFKDYYEKESDWQADFDRFKLTLAVFDIAR